jgi:hypothetical protein
MRVVGHDCPVNEQLKMASHDLGDSFRFRPIADLSQRRVIIKRART